MIGDMQREGLFKRSKRDYWKIVEVTTMEGKRKRGQLKKKGESLQREMDPKIQKKTRANRERETLA